MDRRTLLPHEDAYLDRVYNGLVPGAPDAAREAAVEYARNLLSFGFPVLFDQRHLAHVTGVSSQSLGVIRAAPERFYSYFRIPKRGGGSRVIASPTPVLKAVQNWLHGHITTRLPAHDSAHGFVAGRSIVSNAFPHVAAGLILKLDIEDFFGSVRRGRVYRFFRRAGYARQVADLLASLTTLRSTLPQGAPTSPALANVAAYGLDARLSGLARKRRCRYTRYADDISLSGSRDLDWSATRRKAELIMRDEGFRPNEAKMRFVSHKRRQVVTGVVVNEKLNWPRLTRRWLRQEIYYLRKYGVDDHLRRRAVNPARYKEFIYGHVCALNSVRPDEAGQYLVQLDEVEWPY